MFSPYHSPVIKISDDSTMSRGSWFCRSGSWNTHTDASKRFVTGEKCSEHSEMSHGCKNEGEGKKKNKNYW